MVSAAETIVTDPPDFLLLDEAGSGRRQWLRPPRSPGTRSPCRPRAVSSRGKSQDCGGPSLPAAIDALAAEIRPSCAEAAAGNQPPAGRWRGSARVEMRREMVGEAVEGRLDLPLVGQAEGAPRGERAQVGGAEGVRRNSPCR